MSQYKSIFFPSQIAVSKKKYENMVNKVVDGSEMERSILALLYKNEPLGFYLEKIEAILSKVGSNMTYTEGKLVILKKKK